MENRLIVRYHAGAMNTRGRPNKQCAERWRGSVEGARRQRLALIPRAAGNRQARHWADGTRKASVGAPP
jgi:hypothetical protein